MMTPEDFAKKMREFFQGSDTEYDHAHADDLMCEVLEDLGYAEGIAIYKNPNWTKWYA